MKKSLWFLAALLTFSCLSLQGQAGEKDIAPELIRSLKNQLNSEPVKAGAALDQFLKSKNPDDDPVTWLQIFTLHLLLFRDDFDGPDSKILQKKLLPKAEAIARSLPESRAKLEFDTEIMYARMFSQLREKNLPDYNPIYRDLLARAEKSGWHGLASRILCDYATAKNFSNEGEESFRLASQALDSLRRSSDEDPFDVASVKASVALIFINQERRSEALALYIEIEKSLCKDLQNAYFCATILLSIANIYLDPLFEEDLPKAEEYLDRALKAAETIHDDWAIGSIHYYRANVYTRQKKFREALESSQRSLVLMERFHDENLVFVNLGVQARSNNALSNFQQALALLQKAEKYANDKTDNRKLLDQIYVVTYAGLEQYKNAFTVQQRLYKSLQHDTNIKLEANYNTAMAQVGLQLEKEKNRVLEKDQEIIQLKLHESEKVRRFLLFSLVLLLLLVLVCIWAILRSREVKRIKNSLQNVLDTIEEAILSIDPALKIKGPTSRFLQNLKPLAQNPVGQDFIDFILSESQLSGDQCATIREVLKASMGEEMLAWELNAALLPLEITYKKDQVFRLFAINWQPILDRSGIIVSVMVSLHDITERRALEQAVEIERHERSLASNCLLELSKADINRSRQVIEEARAFVKTIPNGPVPDSTLREIHTLKGTARSLKLKGLSSVCHDFEESVKNGSMKVQPLLELLEIYHEIIQQIQPENMGLAVTEPIDLLSLWQRLQPALLGRLQEEHLNWGGFAVFDRVNTWPQEYLKDLESCLLHAINNSIDHGFVRPKKEGRSSSLPYFELEGLRQDNELIVTFRDNGVGLDFTKLQTIASNIGFVPGPGETLADIVFYDGVSTAGSVTETSGRGVGMAAVRAICRERQGQANIAPAPFPSGTELRLRFPLPGV